MVYLSARLRAARCRDPNLSAVSPFGNTNCPIPFKSPHIMDAMQPPLPCKLKARRVREHVSTTLIAIRRMRLARDAAQCEGIDAMTWETLDLYTLALDTAPDERLRELVAQARGTLLAHLTR
jgi:hypothetical protein